MEFSAIVTTLHAVTMQIAAIMANVMALRPNKFHIVRAARLTQFTMVAAQIVAVAHDVAVVMTDLGAFARFYRHVGLCRGQARECAKGDGGDST